MRTDCNKSFVTLGNLKSHELSHSESKIFKCHISGCDCSYNQKIRLDIHLRTHVGCKPFKCEFAGCDKTFNEKGNLKTHKRYHTNEKPYKCFLEGCSEEFKYSNKLKLHLKTHNYLNDTFYCSICKKPFARYSTLISHTYTHQDANFINCDSNNNSMLSTNREMLPTPDQLNNEQPIVNQLPLSCFENVIELSSGNCKSELSELTKINQHDSNFPCVQSNFDSDVDSLKDDNQNYLSGQPAYFDDFSNYKSLIEQLISKENSGFFDCIQNIYAEFIQTIIKQNVG